MRIAILVAMLVLAGPATGALAGPQEPGMDPKLSFSLAGIGGRSCGFWLENSPQKAAGDNWLLGFLTGANFKSAALKSAGLKHVGKSTDAAGVLAEVEAQCRTEPSKALADAAILAYVNIMTREARESR